MSDLIDISTPSLPTNIDLQLGTGILKGTYNLQVYTTYIVVALLKVVNRYLYSPSGLGGQDH